MKPPRQNPAHAPAGAGEVHRQKTFSTVGSLLRRMPDRPVLAIGIRLEARGTLQVALQVGYIDVSAGTEGPTSYRPRRALLLSKKPAWPAANQSLRHGVGLFRSGALGAARIRCPIASLTARPFVLFQ
jgi:hypothetical protein